MWWMMAAQIAKQATANAITLWATKADAAAMKGQASQYRQAAGAARRAAMEQANARQDQLRRLFAANVNDAMSRGVDPYEGSTLNALERGMTLGQRDIDEQKIANENQARAFEYAAIMMRKKARQTMIGGILNLIFDSGMTAFQQGQTMGPMGGGQPASPGGGGGSSALGTSTYGSPASDAGSMSFGGPR